MNTSAVSKAVSHVKFYRMRKPVGHINPGQVGMFVEVSQPSSKIFRPSTQGPILGIPTEDGRISFNVRELTDKVLKHFKVPLEQAMDVNTTYRVALPVVPAPINALA